MSSTSASQSIVFGLLGSLFVSILAMASNVLVPPTKERMASNKEWSLDVFR